MKLKKLQEAFNEIEEWPYFFEDFGGLGQMESTISNNAAILKDWNSGCRVVSNPASTECNLKVPQKDLAMKWVEEFEDVNEATNEIEELREDEELDDIVQRSWQEYLRLL